MDKGKIFHKLITSIENNIKKSKKFSVDPKNKI